MQNERFRPVTFYIEYWPKIIVIIDKNAGKNVGKLFPYRLIVPPTSKLIATETNEPFRVSHYGH